MQMLVVFDCQLYHFPLRKHNRQFCIGFPCCIDLKILRISMAATSSILSSAIGEYDTHPAIIDVRIALARKLGEYLISPKFKAAVINHEEMECRKIGFCRQVSGMRKVVEG